MPIATTNARRSLLSNAVGVLSDVSALALRISIVEAPGGGLIKTMSFTQSMTVYDACRHIRDKLLDEYNLGQPKDYGLFLFDETTSEGVWLEQNRTLDYYMLRNNDTLEYRKKIRPLRVRMLDDSIKTLLVDDSQPVSNLMVVICTKIGITNHDEYALVRNEPELLEATDAKPNTGTQTLRRKKQQEDRERDAKMEQLRKTLRTDDEVDWVDPLKTLREQGIDETETLLLRRKFFFSDGNIDSRDPVELNLLYVQARDAILDGTHPVTQDQACEFAGIQVHIQFGDYNESKHRPGFLDLKEFLPQSYIKDKGIEKKIYSEHKKHIGVSEVEAKVLYTKTARSLTTYGVTFFLVKEKMQGKNKLVPRLLGITKDSILRLDEKTKEILKTWPLTTVRRWGASPNTFTLDFGDYSDAYYSVKTPEAEQILQLIDGYIDIILKKQQAKEHIGLEGEEGATLFEDNVSSKQATVMRHGNLKPTNLMPELMSRISMRAAMTDSFQENLQYSTSSGPANLIHAAPSPQRKVSKTINVMTEPKRALLTRLNSTRDMLQEIQQLVSSSTDLPELGADPASHQWREITLDTCRHNVAGYIAAMNAATAQVVLLTANEEIDFNAVAAAIQMIQNNLPEMTKDVKMIAVLMDDKQKGEKLLHSTHNLLEAFEDLISEAEPQKSEPREKILNAATRVGEASQSVLSTISDDSEQNKELQNILLSLGKAIASNTAAVVLKAKSIATNCKNEEAQTKVVDSATECALATSELVTCANVVASTINNPACQAQLMASIRETSRCLELLVTDCVDSCQSKTLQGELQSAAQIVTEKLNDLVNHITKGTSESYQETNLETVLVASDKIIATENPSEMVKQAQILGQAATQLLQSIKSEADKQTDPEMQERLLNIGYNLAEATAQLVEAARHCANSPGDATYQNALRRAAEQLREVTSLAATTPAIKMHALEKLEQHARQAASDAAQYVYAVKAISPEHKNDPQWTALEEDCTVVKEHMNKMVDAACRFKRQPEQLTVQMGLVNSSEQFLQPAWRLIHAMRSITTTLPPSHTSAMVATSAAQQLTTSIGALESSLGRAKTALVAPSSKLMQSEVESVEDTNKKWAKEQFEASNKVLFGLQQELEELDRVQKLTPLPGETPESSAATLISVAKSIPQITAQLISAIEQNEYEYAGRMASTLASSLQELTSASRSVAAQDPSVHHGIINSAREVVVNSNDLLRDVQSDILDSDGKLKPNVIKTMKDISEAVNRCLNNLPGQQDVDEVISNMNAKFNTLTIDEFPPPPSDKTYNELQQELNIAAAHLNDISADLISSVSNPVAFANFSRAYEQAYNRLHGISLEMIGQSQDPIVSQQIVDYLKHMLSVSSKLLQTAKLVSADPTAPNNKNKLTAAARSITDSINDLLDIYSTAAPGQKECDNVTRNIQNLKPVINNPTEPISDLSYFECLDAVIERSKKLGDAMTGITNYAKNSEHEKFGVAVKDVDNSVSGLIEAATQAAYLVGISDPTSIPGRPGLVDQAQFARASQAIATACQTISNPKSSQPEILSATTLIAKQTTALCNACKAASSQTNNPVAKRQFVQSAKDLANSTSALIKDIKVLDSDSSDVNRNKCIEATKPLLDIVDNICVFASSSEFVSHPAKISKKAKEKQEIIIQPGCKIIDSSSAMVTAAKSLVISPRDPPTWQILINSIKEVSDAIKKLLSNISENYPGQNECVEVINSLYSHLKSLDASSMAMMSGQSTGQFNSAVPGTQQEKLSLALSAANEISDRIEAVRIAGRGQTQNLGRAVIDMARYFNPLVNGCIGASTTLLNSKHQMLLIDQTKTVTESATQLMYAVKESGGNPKALNVHPEIDEYASSIQKALQELMATLDHLSTQSGVYTGVIDTVARSMSKLTNQQLSPSLNYSESDNYVDFQTRMVENSKEIAHLVQEIVSKATTSPSEIGPLCSEFSRRYVALANDAPGAAACCSNSEVSQRMRGVVLELGQAVSSLVGAVSTGTSRGMADEARVVSEKVAQVLATLQFGSRGIQACINAASTISGVIGDLDTTIMFATAGTLHPDDEEDSFSHHREAILKTAKVLVGDIKALVAGTASTQDQLAVAVQNSVTTIVQLSEVVKVGAACLSSSSPDAQIMLMNAVRDVASALGDLVQATKGASRKSISHPTMDRLKKSANVMETNITMLLNTVKSVEDEHTRGTRALESTIEVIGQEMKVLYSTSSVQKVNATPEELMQCTKAITVATAKAVAAGNSNKQDDMIQAANIGRKAISDMLVICRGTAHNCAETKELRERTLNAGNEVAILYKELLQLILIPSTENRQMIPNVSRRLAKNVNELVIVAKLLKGSNWVDPEDPTVIAENELLTAAASIDAAAKKLASLRPRKIVQETDETLNFDEMIIEAAKSIAGATSALVKAASAAQRELIETGKVTRRPSTSSDDGQWSEGLVSAARMVAAATHTLVESANSLVQGVASEEKLISAAKQVASSTKQLLFACQVKADPDSDSMKRLQSAGNAVAKATENLVKSAQQSIDREEKQSVEVNRNMVGKIAQELDRMAEVLRIEKELEKARAKLVAVRKDKYT